MRQTLSFSLTDTRTHRGMTSNDQNGAEGRENFNGFFENWITEQNQHLHDLITASKSPTHVPESSTTVTESDRVLCDLINRVVQHYEEYYRAKTRWAKDDVLAILSPAWTSSLEDAFLWIGGWRPTMAFHLFYSISGLQFEARLAELIRGVKTGDLGDLCPSQLGLVDKLHRRTVAEEKKITEKMASHQETLADSEMVVLSDTVTELMGNGEASQDDGGGGGEEGRVESALASKEDGLEKILEMADDLRLRTLKSVTDILSPIQAVHFLIAAAKLHLRLHDWGKDRDARQSDDVGGSNQPL